MIQTESQVQLLDPMMMKSRVEKEEKRRESSPLMSDIL